MNNDSAYSYGLDQ